MLGCSPSVPGTEGEFFCRYDDADAYDYLLEDESTAPLKQIIYHRIRMEYFRELFEALPRRDKDILGKYYGVFGYKREPVDDIAMYHFLSEKGVKDAREKAVIPKTEIFSNTC